MGQAGKPTSHSQRSRQSSVPQRVPPCQYHPRSDGEAATEDSSQEHPGTTGGVYRIGRPRRLCGKESACSAGGMGSILVSGKSSEKGNGSPLQYSRLECPMDRGAWPATVHGVAKSGTGLSD